MKICFDTHKDRLAGTKAGRGARTAWRRSAGQSMCFVTGCCVEDGENYYFEMSIHLVQDSLPTLCIRDVYYHLMHPCCDTLWSWEESGILISIGAGGKGGREE